MQQNLIFTDFPDVKWSIGFIVLMTIIYIIRDILAPKHKKKVMKIATTNHLKPILFYVKHILIKTFNKTH
ncbi:hypothetical protein ASS83_12780 [Staphylococcus saprophyticus]|nr:hypothetical protein ASS83_12780 [Staphylococcus saprophyticus]